MRGLSRGAQLVARRGYAEEASASQKLRLTLAMPSNVSGPALLLQDVTVC